MVLLTDSDPKQPLIILPLRKEDLFASMYFGSPFSYSTSWLENIFSPQWHNNEQDKSLLIRFSKLPSRSQQQSWIFQIGEDSLSHQSLPVFPHLSNWWVMSRCLQQVISNLQTLQICGKSRSRTEYEEVSGNLPWCLSFSHTSGSWQSLFCLGRKYWFILKELNVHPSVTQSLSCARSQSSVCFHHR